MQPQGNRIGCMEMFLSDAYYLGTLEPAKRDSHHVIKGQSSALGLG